jgi:hypothetical protein
MGLEPADLVYVTVTAMTVSRTEHAMINAASKRAIRAIPKLVFGLVLCFGLALAAPMLWAYVPFVFWH